MTYCINPSCSQPKNPLKTLVCQACGSKLLLRNRYLAMKSLGKGGFGATFLAVDLSLPGKPTCVIKQLRPSMNDPDIFEMAKELFEREAQTLGRIGNHPQIPRLLDYFEDTQQFYLVQEFVSGHNLQKEIKQNGTYSEVATRQFLSEILPILNHIHSQEVIHRDIKPANLIRRQQDSQLVLIDFGAVKTEISQPEPGATGQTALTAFAVGTTGYAPPEQLAMRPVFASDLYAVAATCIYLLTGKPPKDIPIDPNTGEIMWRKYIEVSDGFARVLNKMLESSVKYRYKSANEALNALNLEPYHDTLSQGLITTPTNNNLNGNGSASGALNSQPIEESSNTSITANLANQIRARRQRQAARKLTNTGSVKSIDRDRKTPQPQAAEHNSPFSYGTGYQRGFTNGTKTNKASRKTTTKVPQQVTSKKLNSDTLIKDYSKGRRDFAQQDLNNLNLQKTQLSGGNFYQSKLIQVNFGGADLSGTDFGRAILIKAVLRNANLSRAYLSYTNLEGADLRGADLTFASLNYANLKGANLCGANLRNAKISERQLSQAKTNWATIMPSGKRGFW